ncbi:ATP-dependent helicase [Anaerococcus prevotii]|uniref:DNA 3'-5' helicase n=1 Tax=Anaerococcus prevotii ACS-065-V-Col13 TaxID=879305 RepID=F0GUD0_9FIRM|nr:UvrD-helicase domain-containing protein [Anaerococcus prevotii]EGC82331.1 putative ATP-dependent DNA helicase PcrA [Anaerococcus prevotii ACS-065-V-Col13]
MKLDSLNNMQKKAVLHDKGPLLVLAGAGSGKTRVLTTSIAYLIEEKNIDPRNIIAITFTNKAANEMKERISNLLNMDVSHLWIGTFHSICARILRMNIDKIGYDKNFTIYDSSDQKTLVKEIINELGFKEDITPREALNVISQAKNKSMTPDEFLQLNTYYTKGDSYYEIYKKYEEKKFYYNALDFDDLIDKVLYLFSKDIETLKFYQEKFQYVFVDEYQDTNNSQYELIKYFSGFHNNITVVGDADQSIYSFRGADISNILNFEKDFKDADVIKLEQNYRSTDKILDTANVLIENNSERKDKNLWTDNKNGSKPIYRSTNVESEEAKFVLDNIKELTYQGYDAKDFAILYRTNAQSRSFEEILMKNLINYKVIGGLKFYDRKEIKDLVSYLKIIVNPKDDLALKRIINEPKRGIGNKSIAELESISSLHEISMLDLIRLDEFRPLLNDRLKKLADKFYMPLKDIFDNIEKYKIVDLINEVLDKSGYLKMLETSYSVEDRSRIDNINEFISSAAEYEEENSDDTIFDYLENLSLLSDLDKTEDKDNSVSLMTMHAAKGLEFPIVFVVGLDEGLFPGKRSIDEGNVEEERRLFYVGITRAREKLFLTSSKSRRNYGKPIFYKPSRFVDEIIDKVIVEEDSSSYGFTSREYEKAMAEDYMREKTRQSVLNKKLVKTDASDSDFQVGDKIRHSKWGMGTIVQIKEQDKGNELVVAFDKKGLKKLNQDYAPIEKV